MTSLRVGFASAALLGCGALPEETEPAAVEARLRSATALPARSVESADEEREIQAQIDELLGRELGSDDAVRIALWNNRDLRAAWARLAAVRAEVREETGFPELFLGAEIRFPEEGRTALEFELVQDLFALLTRGPRRKIALSGFEREVLTLGEELLELATEVRHAYYELVALQQEIAVQDEIAAAAAAARTLAEGLLAAGNVSALDLAREQAMEEHARLDLARSQMELVPLRERLNVLLGLWGERIDWSVPSRLPELPALDPAREGLESLAVSRDPELAARTARLEEAARSLGIVRGSWGFVELEGGATAHREGEEGWSYGPVLGIGLPLSGQRGARVDRLAAELAEAEAELAQRAVEVRSGVRAAHDALLRTRQIAERYGASVVPVHERIVRLAQEEYNFMLIGAFELLEDRREQSEAYHAYVGAVRDYWIAAADLEHALAGPLPEAAASEPVQPAEEAAEPKPEPSPHHDHGGKGT